MEIQDFVTETITQICKGIQQAKKHTQEFGAIIAPAIDNNNCVSLSDSQKKVQFIHFDMHVTERQEKQSDGKVKITLATLSVGVGGVSSNEGQNSHHVSFDIPILWPGSDYINKISPKTGNVVTTRYPYPQKQ